MRLGIFGGTFNPIHLGHLLLAETAREACHLDRVLFIPTNQPPHKDAKGVLAGPTRLALIQLAIRDHPGFAASDIELQRAGPSYTIETIRTLRRQLPDAKLFLLMGEDMLAVPWKGWAELKRLCAIVAVRRSGARGAKRDPAIGPWPLAVGPLRVLQREGGRDVAPRGAGSRVPRAVPVGLHKTIQWVQMPQVDITSSDIRRRLKTGRSIRYLVPGAVERYVRQHHCYR